MRLRRLGVVIVPILSSVALLAQGQGERPQFRAGVELMQLDVAVMDDGRHPVRGLTAADFTVFENGVSRPIRAFTPVELDARPRTSEAVWAAAVAPDVTTNAVSEQDGRLVIILMDRSIPAHQPTVAAKKIASRVIEELGPHDLAAVVSTSQGRIQNLTSDRARLLRAIDASSTSTGMSPEAEELMSRGLFGMQNDGSCLCGLCVLETITRVAESVENTPRRRKTLFFIGSSLKWQGGASARTRDVAGCDARLRDARTKLFAATDRANLTVHSLDPQGLVNIGEHTRASALNGRDSATTTAPIARLRNLETARTDSLVNDGSLRVLPDHTGGRTVVSRNDLEDVVPEIFRESEAYYVLGIERGAPPPDGSRTIEVKVGRKGLHTYAQRQYVEPHVHQPASAGPAVADSPSIDDALTHLLPNAVRPLALGVTPFANPVSAKSLVRINVDVGAFTHGDGSAVPLEIAVMAVDPLGQTVATVRQTSTVAGLPLDSAAGAAPRELNVQSQLELAEGDYGIRVAVSDAATGVTGSVFADVTVPAFENIPLSLSGVSVESASNASGTLRPTTRRVFGRAERVRAVLQIYQGTSRSDALGPVSIQVRIVDAKGTAIRDQSLPFTAQAFTNRRTDCVITLPLAGLPVGEYLLQLDASLGRDTSARAVRFAVK